MPDLTIESLGLSKDEIADRIVTKLSSDLLRTHSLFIDDEGNDHPKDTPSPFALDMQKSIAAKVLEAIDAIALKNVLPNMGAAIETFCLQQTNSWGEKTGKPVTFTEYLVASAEAYLAEQVNWDGKTQKQTGYGYSDFKPAGTRLSHAIHQYIQFHIEQAMRKLLQDGTSQLTKSLEETCKIKLVELAKTLTVSTTIKS